MSEFHRLLLGLHARARRVDRDQALLGALGVGAIAYPHQIESVRRMVTGTSCRWLLADEVGLGKTIQAIMVVRALAAQSPRPLAVALVVPDDLAAQWVEEALCRGHTLPLESGEGGAPVGNVVLRLVRPSLLLAGGRIAAGRVDLLIVDEFTRLQVQVRRDLAAAARSIPNVLVLTATPAMHLPAPRRELMALIEPEADRIAQAEGRDILDVLAEREERAIERHGADLGDAAGRRRVGESFGVFRHLIRTERTDYPGALPRRVYQPIRLTPTDGDVGRAKATRAYLEAAKDGDVGIRRGLLLQVAGRSPASLRERLSTLGRTSPPLQGAWRLIDGCLRDEQGDAKLDALIDHVREVHARDPDARLVVVAEDNPTTDYLRDALEKLADVQVARKRRSAVAAEALEAQVVQLKEALDDFIGGEAKVLVAADAAREGHNLQFADEIVFFALPWSPTDIQQWIGRIDRLGAKGSAERRIRITPIVVDGSVEEQILAVLEATGVFVKSEVFDESEWGAIDGAIAAAADGGGAGSWTDAIRHARNLGDGFDTWRLVTRLPPSSRAAIATRCEAGFRDRAYALPMAPVEGFPWNWYLMRERAADVMLKLARVDHLDVRNGSMGDQRFKTVWYKSRPGPGDFTIPDLDAGSSWHRQAFVSRRASIGCPPRTHVVQADQEKRRLHFFDHGSSLHDSAVAAFERQKPATDIRTEFVVEYPVGHPALRWAGRRLLVAAAVLEFCGAVALDLEAALGSAERDASKAEQDARAAAEGAALAQFQADRRWLVDLAPPQFLAMVMAEDAGAFVPADEAASAVFDPFLDRDGARQLTKRRGALPEADLRAARSGALDRLRKLAVDARDRAVGAVRKAVDARLFAARADAEFLASAAQAELAATRSLDSKLEFNKAAQRGAALAAALTDALWACRLARLRGVAEAVRTGAQQSQATMFWLIPRHPDEQDR